MMRPPAAVSVHTYTIIVNDDRVAQKGESSIAGPNVNVNHTCLRGLLTKTPCRCRTRHHTHPPLREVRSRGALYLRDGLYPAWEWHSLSSLVLATALDYSRTRVYLGVLWASSRADDTPISGGSVDSCSRENPPTAVSVFPLSIHKIVGSCRYANLLPWEGGERRGMDGASPIGCVELGDVTDWQRV